LQERGSSLMGVKQREGGRGEKAFAWRAQDRTPPAVSEHGREGDGWGKKGETLSELTMVGRRKRSHYSAPDQIDKVLRLSGLKKRTGRKKNQIDLKQEAFSLLMGGGSIWKGQGESGHRMQEAFLRRKRKNFHQLKRSHRFKRKGEYLVLPWRRSEEKGGFWHDAR